MSARFVIVLLATVASCAALDLFAATQNILSKCDTIKSLLGISYSAVESKNVTLDVNGIKLVFASGGFNDSYDISTAANDILVANHYNISQKLYVFVHGWQSDASGSNGIVTALYDNGASNVLALDSSAYLKNWNYLHCSLYVKFVGQKLAEVLIALNEAGLHRKNIHLIGHSLGAQICSFAGSTFQEWTNTSVARISGLDPAGPCFSELGEKYRLSSDDADFVDVIHSNAGIAGIREPSGDLDFYPNGGTQQPGCLLPTCDHGRSMEFYAESITNPKAFPAIGCGDWDYFGNITEGDVRYMGFGATKPETNGSYFLRTGSKPPYGLGEDGLTKATNVFKNLLSFFG